MSDEDVGKRRSSGDLIAAAERDQGTLYAAHYAHVFKGVNGQEFERKLVDLDICENHGVNEGLARGTDTCFVDLNEVRVKHPFERRAIAGLYRGKYLPAERVQPGCRI